MGKACLVPLRRIIGYAVEQYPGTRRSGIVKFGLYQQDRGSQLPRFSTSFLGHPFRTSRSPAIFSARADQPKDSAPSKHAGAWSRTGGNKAKDVCGRQVRKRRGGRGGDKQNESKSCSCIGSVPDWGQAPGTRRMGGSNQGAEWRVGALVQHLVPDQHSRCDLAGILTNEGGVPGCKTPGSDGCAPAEDPDCQLDWVSQPRGRDRGGKIRGPQGWQRGCSWVGPPSYSQRVLCYSEPMGGCIAAQSDHGSAQPMSDALEHFSLISGLVTPWPGRGSILGRSMKNW